MRVFRLLVLVCQLFLNVISKNIPRLFLFAELQMSILQISFVPGF
jgi:hypothetical protein